MKKIGRLCIITDTNVQLKYSHVELAEMAIKGGADIIQFRDKFMGTADMISTARAIRKICTKKGAIFLVNDRVDVALVSEADGVHLGKDDIPVYEARKLLGSRKIVGGTAHSLKEALMREKEGADYIGFGHIYETFSKEKKGRPKGTDYLRKVVDAISVPVIAIGGINITNIDDVMQTGVHGAALIGSVVKSKDPIKIVRELREKIYRV